VRTRRPPGDTDHPNEEIDMLSVHANGERSYRLENEARVQVGWIRGRAVGFGGIRSVEHALAAAPTGARALHAALRREHPGWPHAEPALHGLRLVHDGAYEWISDSAVPVARLLRGVPNAPALAPFGIEYVLPTFATDGLAITVAQSMARVLQPILAFTLPQATPSLRAEAVPAPA
jgi:hypothetical protein